MSSQEQRSELNVSEAPGINPDLSAEAILISVGVSPHPALGLYPKVVFRGELSAPLSLLHKSDSSGISLNVIFGEKGRGEFVLEQGKSVEGVRLERLEITPARSVALARTDAEQRGYFSFSGLLDLSALVPSENDLVRQCVLSTQARIGSHVSVSAVATFPLFAENKWFEPVAGFLCPLMSVVCSNFVVIQGWAFCREDPLQRVDIGLNQQVMGSAQYYPWDTDLHQEMENFSDLRAFMFTKTFFRDDLDQQGGLQGEVFQPSATCYFRSGRSLDLPGPNFVWKKNLFTKNNQEQVFTGELERVGFVSPGRVQVEGWVFSPGVSKPRIFLEGMLKRVELTENGLGDSELRWLDRDDVTSQFAPVAWNRSYGFQLKFHPLLLGRFAAPLRLSAENGPRRLVLGPRVFSKRISKFANTYARFKSFSERGAAGVLTLLGAIAVRRKYRISDYNQQQVATGAERKILFMTHNLSSYEGAPRMLKEIILSRADKNNCLIVSARDGQLRQVFEDQGISVEVIHELDLVGQTWPRYCQGLSRLIDRARSFGANLIMANVIDSFCGVDAAFFLNRPALWLIHESVNPLEVFPHLDPLLKLRFLDRLLGVEKAVFVAESTKDLFTRYLKGQQAVVPNGVNVNAIDLARAQLSRSVARRQLGMGEDLVIISIVGTTVFRKGQDIFIREAENLMRQEPGRKFHFFIVGAREIPFLQTLRALIDKKGLTNYVTLVPETADVSQFYIASDMMVVASREESAPLVSLEAFAFERPLVSTNVFGLAEQVRHLENAWVFEPNVPGSLAQGMGEILNNPELATKLVKNARKDVEQKFNLATTLKHHWEQIDTLLDSNQALR